MVKTINLYIEDNPEAAIVLTVIFALYVAFLIHLWID